MQRTLSWRWTFVVTRLLPAFWIAFFGFSTLQLLLRLDTVVFNSVRGGAPPAAGWQFLALWIVGSVLLVVFGRALKRVRLAGDGLLISNYLREVPVSLSSVTSVRQLPLFGLITLEFAVDTPFGRRVTFIPDGIVLRPGEEAAVVHELQAEVAHAINRAPGG